MYCNARRLLWLPLVLVWLSGCSTGKSPVLSQSVVLEFGPALAIQESTVELYVESEPGTAQIRPARTTDLQHAVDRQFFGPPLRPAGHSWWLDQSTISPVAQGCPLGFTLGEWLAATGRGHYRVEGDLGELALRFDHLRPNSLYSLWCTQVTLQPRLVIEDQPCGLADGSTNQFQSYANGSAEFSVRLRALPSSTPQKMVAIRLAYHAGGERASAHQLDANSHIQLMAFLPLPIDLAWQKLPATALAAGACC